MRLILIPTCSGIWEFLLPKQKKLSSHGGVLVLVRKQFLSFVERMHVDVDNVVVLRMKKVLLGKDKDVMFIAACLPPYDSNSTGK